MTALPGGSTIKYQKAGDVPFLGRAGAAVRVRRHGQITVPFGFPEYKSGKWADGQAFSKVHEDGRNERDPRRECGECG